MVLMKSFFRKKTTKIYILVFILLVLSYIACNGFKDYYLEFSNSNYEGSYAYFRTNDVAIEKIQSIENVKYVYKSAIIYFDNIEIIFTTPDFIGYDGDFADNSILIPNVYEEDFTIGEQYTMEINNQSIDLVIQDFADLNNIFIYFVSEETIDFLIENEMGESAYTITLQNWIDRDNTFKEVQSVIGVEFYASHIVNNHKISFDYLVKVFDVFITVIIFIFIIIFITTLFNIWNDERKHQLIYKSMGYSKIKLLKLLLIKIVIILLIIIITYILGLFIYSLFK